MRFLLFFFFFFFNDTATTEIYTLSLHDALPICLLDEEVAVDRRMDRVAQRAQARAVGSDSQIDVEDQQTDRKSTRLNSSHLVISYAVFCLKKKKKKANELQYTINTKSSTETIDI